MVKNRLLYLLFLLGVFVFFLYYFAWFSWYLLVLTVAFPLLSLVASLPAMVTMKPELSCPAAAVRGETACVSAKSSGLSFMPAPTCRFRLAMTNQMTGASVIQKATISGGHSYSSQLDTSHCGACVCHIEKIWVYDYLGLFRIPVSAPKTVEMLIKPSPQPMVPTPNFSLMQYKTYHPKVGGGFSEIHDMRQYRPGDSMRDIHWKLSSKLDDLIVREAQEVDRRQVIVSFDFGGDSDALDSTLDQLLWLSDKLTQLDIEHDLVYLDPETMAAQRSTITTSADLEIFICRLLRQRASQMPGAVSSFPQADWHCHIANLS